MSDDIVARLREEGFITHMARLPRESKILHEAADEMELLRYERDGFREGNRQTLAALAEANTIAKWYKRERDEARREVCALTPFVRLETQSAEEYASTRGWNCFKEAR